LPSDAFAELNADGTRINIHFSYTPQRKDAVKAIPGAKFVGPEKGGPYWHIPLTLVAAREMRKALPDMQIGNALRVWGREAVQKERNLRAMAVQDDVPLDQLSIAEKLPVLAESLRPYQRADTKFMATTNVLNGNSPRLGKTREVIAAVYEAGLEMGAHLVIAPKTALEMPWRQELEALQPLPVFTFSGDTPAQARITMPRDCREALEDHGGYWMCTTASMLRSGEFDKVKWNSFTIDEFRKTGLSNMRTQFHKAATKAKSQRRFALSGTPMGGRIFNLFPILQWLEPKLYTSAWEWANQWLVVTKEQVYVRGKQRTFMDVGGIRPGLEEEFYASLAPHFVRRLRSEVLPQLPEKQYIDVPCVMTPNQKKQYKQFALDAEVRIEERRLSAVGILAEYQRLKQFASAYCATVESTEIPCHKCQGTGGYEGASCFRCQGTGIWIVLHPIPTPDSGKMEPLLERLAEAGIEKNEPSGDTQVVIASQFKEMIDMVTEHLISIGIPAEKMTGDTRGPERDRIRRAFQSGEGPRVLCMTTGTGGVAIELNRASEIHILDETWDPDDQEQLEDRLINTTKHHQVTCLYYRMKDTIEEFIQETTAGKAVTNKVILDLRRQGFRATVMKEMKAA